MNKSPNYLLLLASQFIGAFGDNAILAVILGQLTFLMKQGAITETQLSSANAIYTSLLFVPYVVLAPLAGYLNDRHAKTRWLRGGNLIKLIGTAIAALSIWSGTYWQAVGYLIVGIGSCIYSPAKYGILPEIVDREWLVKANGTVELLTLVAILTGFIGGAKMVDMLPIPVCYAILLIIYGVSLILNLFMTPTPEHPEVRWGSSVGEFFSNFRDLLSNPRLFRVLCGTGLFWICGATMKINFQPWGLYVLKFETNTQIALLGLWLSLGIMAGSVLAGQIHKVGDLRSTRRYGWTLSGLVLCLGLVESLISAHWLPERNRLPEIGMLLLTGAFAGLFLIPLNAALQSESHRGRLGKTVATQNFVDNIGMVGAGAMVLAASKFGVNASGVFLVLGTLLALAVVGLKIPSRPTLDPNSLPGK